VGATLFSWSGSAWGPRLFSSPKTVRVLILPPRGNPCMNTWAPSLGGSAFSLSKQPPIPSSSNMVNPGLEGCCCCCVCAAAALSIVAAHHTNHGGGVTAATGSKRTNKRQLLG